jgi:microcystin-dependent protein
VGATPKNAIPYPELGEPADVPADMKEMADRLDTFGFVPPGAMFMFPGVAAPAGFYLMQGQDVPSVDNPTLAAIFGAAGGNVRLPDMRDSFPIGASATRAVLSKGGESTHLINVAELPSHAHPDTLAVDAGGSHNHSMDSQRIVAANYNVPYAGGVIAFGAAPQSGSGYVAPHSTAAGWAGTGGAHAHNITAVGNHSHSLSGAVGLTGDGTPHNNVPPYLAVNYIIRGG